ncbi:MAG: hypothetical protein J6L24_07050 [Oscillospiraceae bacterium]|nr:hypothetical protein [Oscillospiraceae bacterium]
MNILYCGDKNIADGLMISVLSLLRQVKEPLHIYILTMSQAGCQPLPNELAEVLEKRVCPGGGTATLLDVSDLFTQQPPTANLVTRFTPCCMLRLYADLLPEIPDRILYLDTDVVCRLDCREFYEQDMGDAEVAGILDYYGSWFFRRNILRRDYLNSGVLLLNMKRIRQTGLFQKCRIRCAEKEMFMPDQSAINKLAIRKKILPRRYNEQRKLHPDTVLQHFSTNFRFFPYIRTVTVKPWQPDRMHEVLKLYEYDDLLEEFRQWKAENQPNFI